MAQPLVSTLVPTVSPTPAHLNRPSRPMGRSTNVPRSAVGVDQLTEAQLAEREIVARECVLKAAARTSNALAELTGEKRRILEAIRVFDPEMAARLELKHEALSNALSSLGEVRFEQEDRFGHETVMPPGSPARAWGSR